MKSKEVKVKDHPEVVKAPKDEKKVAFGYKANNQKRDYIVESPVRMAPCRDSKIRIEFCKG